MEHEGRSLDQLLNDEPLEDAAETQPVETAPEVAELPQEAPDGPARGPDGKFLPKQETGVNDAGPPPDKLPQEDYKAIREEREKRQRLEAELEALKQQFQSQQPKEPPAPPPSVWEDENAWGGQLVNSAVAQSTYQSKLLMSEMLVSQQHEDFAEIKDKLMEFVGANPAINQQVAESQHPWMTAYKAFKNQQAMQELGATDLETLRAKIREELQAEMQTAQVPVQRPGVPPTLTGERNVGTRTGPEWAGPKPLTELLG